jgi:hypothetical protein
VCVPISLDLEGRERVDAVPEPGVRDVGKRWQLEPDGERAMVNREARVVEALGIRNMDSGNGRTS